MKQLAEFSQQSRDANAKTFAALEENADYVHCPQCDGDGQLYAHWDSNDLSCGEYVSCPCCGGTREADQRKAIEWLEGEEARKGWEE